MAGKAPLEAWSSPLSSIRRRLPTFGRGRLAIRSLCSAPISSRLAMRRRVRCWTTWPERKGASRFAYGAFAHAVSLALKWDRGEAAWLDVLVTFDIRKDADHLLRLRDPVVQAINMLGLSMLERIPNRRRLDGPRALDDA